MNIANFVLDKNMCIGCGSCVNVCAGGIIYLNKDRKACFEDVSSFGWNGCWQCEHCLSVCPTGAISIFGHSPQKSILPISADTTSHVMDAIIANRHSCRRYLDKNIEPEILNDMIARLANAPNGGNKQQVEFTLIDDKEQMEHFRKLAYTEMDRLASMDIYPNGFAKDDFEDMKRLEKTVRPDMLFCGAPHLLIPHAPMGKGEPVCDVNIACTYFELICASRGLGAIMLTFPLGVLELMPDIMAMLQIPENHYVGMMVGFGYPEIKYVRGVQKIIEEARIHRPFRLTESRNT